MRPRVPLQIERIIEAFPAERAQIPLHIRMTLHVSVEQTLQRKRLIAHSTTEMRLAILRCNRRHFRLVITPRALSQRLLIRQRILDTVAAVHELQLHLGGQLQL